MAGKGSLNKDVHTKYERCAYLDTIEWLILFESIYLLPKCSVGTSPTYLHAPILFLCDLGVKFI